MSFWAEKFPAEFPSVFSFVVLVVSLADAFVTVPVVAVVSVASNFGIMPIVPFPPVNSGITASPFLIVNFPAGYLSVLSLSETVSVKSSV